MGTEPLPAQRTELDGDRSQGLDENTVEIVSLAGRFVLRELCALIERATLLVRNNTALVHIAAALVIPATNLYALTNS